MKVVKRAKEFIGGLIAMLEVGCEASDPITNDVHWMF